MNSIKRGRICLVVACAATPIIAAALSRAKERALFLWLYGMISTGVVEILCRTCLTSQAKKTSPDIVSKIQMRNWNVEISDTTLKEMICEYKKLTPISIVFVLLVVIIELVFYNGFE